MTLRTIYGRMRTAVQSQWLTAGFYRFQLVGFSIVILGLSVSLSAAEPAQRMFNIEAKPAAQSLTDYAQQAHTQLGYDVDVVDDILTNAVVGEYDSAEALELLLEDTGLTAEHGERGIFIRRVPKREVGGDIEERTPPVAETNSLRFAQTLAAEAHATVDQNQTSRRTETDSGKDEKKRPLEEIIVTGTNIRGIAPDSSPTRTFTREDVQISGAGTAQDFIQTLTANFGGGSNSDITSGIPGDSDAGANSHNTGALGSSVNLRGLGSSSTLVLLNGHRVAPSSGIGDFTDISMIPASAIERVEVLTDGASSIYGADAVAGVTNFILREDFEGVETSFRYGTVTEGDLAEYRASITGGGSWNTGDVLVAYEYFDQGNLSAGDRSFSQGATLPNDILPSQKRHSVLASASQQLEPNLKLFADFLFSNRKAGLDRTSITGALFRSTPSTQSLNFSAGGTWQVSDSWFVDVSGTYSDVASDVNQSGFSTIIRNIDSDLWTLDGKLSGIVSRLPGGDFKLALGGHYREEGFTSIRVDRDTTERNADRDVYAFFGEAFISVFGPSNAISGIKRFEINVSGRFEDYSDFGSTLNPKVGVLWSPVDGLNFRGSYSTSFNPPPLGRVGAFDTNVTILSTSFINQIFGLTPGDPSIADVVEIFVFGTADDLIAENSRSFSAGLDFEHEWGRQTFSFKSTYFDTRFENRLGRPPVPGGNFFDAVNVAFNDPAFFPTGTVIFSPSQSEVTTVLNSADFTVALADPADAEIINFAGVVRNLASTKVRGIDFEAVHTFETETGVLLFSLDGTFLMDFEQQAAVTSPFVELVDTLYNPIDLKLRGRLGYQYNGFAANLFVNYADDYRIDNTPDSMALDSWTTIDISLSYDTREKFENSILNNTELRISVINLFNDDPPLTPSAPSFSIFGFDPANASPLGRFIAFEFRKKF